MPTSDPMLIIVRQHHQDMVQQAQHIRFTNDVKPSPVKNKAILLLRAVLVAIINLVTR